MDSAFVPDDFDSIAQQRSNGMQRKERPRLNFKDPALSRSTFGNAMKELSKNNQLRSPLPEYFSSNINCNPASNSNKNIRRGNIDASESLVHCEPSSLQKLSKNNADTKKKKECARIFRPNRGAYLKRLVEIHSQQSSADGDESKANCEELNPANNFAKSETFPQNSLNGSIFPEKSNSESILSLTNDDINCKSSRKINVNDDLLQVSVNLKGVMSVTTVNQENYADEYSEKVAVLINTSDSTLNNGNSSLLSDRTSDFTKSITEDEAKLVNINLEINCPIPPPYMPSKIDHLPEIFSDNAELESKSIPFLCLEDINGVSDVSGNKLSHEVAGDSTTDSGNGIHGLDCKQVEEISQYLEKLQFERAMSFEIAERVISDLRKVLKYYMKDTSVLLYGSYQSRLAVTTSNLNLALQCGQHLRNSFLLYLQKLLSKELKNFHVSPFEEDTNPRRSKICFSDDDSGVCCEIIYNGVTVSNYIRMSNLLKNICEYDPRIKTLILATRLWAEACSINETESDMLHPIGFTLLMIHFLQQIEKPLLPLINVTAKNWGLNDLSVKNQASIGELWLDYLKYYSYTFNWAENVVSITEKEKVSKSKKVWEVSWIGVEDPITGNNVADSVITTENTEYIISCFKESYGYSVSPASDSDATSGESNDSGSQASSGYKKYSFNNCISHLPQLSCDSCDEDEECGNCYTPRKLTIEKFPQITESSLKCVNRVLHEVYDEFVLPDSKINGRKAFVRDLEKYIKERYPDAKLTLFGSSVNGFGFKNSDLDICVTFGNKPKTKVYENQVLRGLTQHLRRDKKKYKDVIALYGAQIPIVKFRFVEQNWNCDLSLYNVLAVHNSTLLNKYALMDERCRILGCAMKLLAKKAGIADCSLKTLSSYSYILMVIYFLQQIEPPVLPVMPVHNKEVFEQEINAPKDIIKDRNFWFYEDVQQLKKRYSLEQINTLSVGELWLELLEFYMSFNYEKAVSITEKETVLSSSLLRFARLINIEDPFLIKRNLGCIVSEKKAEETRKILHRARVLFGSSYMTESLENLQSYYFSPSNLTGRFIKDIECFVCGGFGHEKSECTKADPFKRFRAKRAIQTSNIRRIGKC